MRLRWRDQRHRICVHLRVTLVALCGAVAEAGGWSGFGLARAAAFTFASVRALAVTLLLVIAVALVLLFGSILVASCVIVAKVGGGSLLELAAAFAFASACVGALAVVLAIALAFAASLLVV